MIKNALICIITFYSFSTAAAFVSKAATPLDRGYMVEKLKPYWGNGPTEKDIVPSDTEILSKTDMGDHIRWHISYMVEDDDKSFAYILLPKPVPTSENPAALMLCPHPTSGIGKDIVCGIHKEPAANEDEAGRRAQRAYALELVRKGFVCFAPDMAGYGERVTIELPTNKFNIEHVAAFKEKWLAKWEGGKFPHAKQLWDIQRGIDMMLEFDFVDKDKIGIIGHSLGAWTAIVAAAYDTRIKASVANAGGGLHFMPQLWEDNQALKDYLGNTSIQNLHNNMNAFIMLTAPRAFLYIKPYNDYVAYERAWQNHFDAFRVISDYYRQVANGDDDYKAPYDIYFHNRKHSFEKDSRALAYAWLDKRLRGNTSFLEVPVKNQSQPVSIKAPKGNRYDVPKLYDIDVRHDVEFAPGLKLDIYSPVSVKADEKFPAIVMIHGGGWVVGTKRQGREVRNSTVLASQGYFCIDIEYTLATDENASWHQVLLDCKNAVKYLRKNADRYKIDPDRIAVMGGSAGGHLALMTAFTGGDEKYKTGLYDEYSDEVCAVIDLYGITNLLIRDELKTNNEKFIGYSLKDRPDLWVAASPYFAVHENIAPVMIFHGTEDASVDVRQSLSLAKKLDQMNLPYEMIIAEGAEHSFTFDSTTTNYWHQFLAFLEKNVKDIRN